MNIINIINDDTVVANITANAANPFEKKIAAIMVEVTSSILNHGSFLKPEEYGYDDFESLLDDVLIVELENEFDTLKRAKIFVRETANFTNNEKTKLTTAKAAEALGEYFIPSINCAVLALIISEKVLAKNASQTVEEQLESLSDMIILNTLLPILDTVSNVWFGAMKTSEFLSFAGIKSVEARKIPERERDLIISMAQKVWGQFETVSSNAMSLTILEKLQYIVEQYDESLCESFVELGLFVEKPLTLDRNGRPKKTYGVISENGKTVFVPNIVAKTSSIKALIEPYVPNVKYKKPNTERNAKIDFLLYAFLGFKSSTCSSSES